MAGLFEGGFGQTELRPYNPSWQDRLGGLLADWTSPDMARRVVGSAGAGRAGPMAGAGLLDMTPLGGLFAFNDYQRGGNALDAAGAIPVPGARVASRAARDAQRAGEALGFRFNMPLYHGSNQAFPAFRAPEPYGANTMVAPNKLGIALAVDDPELAAEYAAGAVKRSGGQGSPQIYKTVHRADRPAALTLAADETDLDVAATLMDAWDAGHDAVMLRNYTSPGGLTGRNVLFVRDPAQLRSPWAAFDPAKRGSGDLLAGLGGLGLLGAGIMGAPSETQAGGLPSYRTGGGF